MNRAAGRSVEVLVSCMHQRDASITERLGVGGDALIINQCERNTNMECCVDYGRRIRMISTTDRGLSRSRNLAISHATGDICLICDEDEILVPDYADIILKAFDEEPTADLIAFALDYTRKRYSDKKCKIGFLKGLKLSSCQMAFKRERVVSAGITFDVQMGSGSGNGAGEDNMFVFDCLRKRLKAFYVPKIIAFIPKSESQWFSGYNKKYFIDKGWASRRLMGWFLALMYACYFTVTKYRRYKGECSPIRALGYQIQGIGFCRSSITK